MPHGAARVLGCYRTLLRVILKSRKAIAVLIDDASQRIRQVGAARVRGLVIKVSPRNGIRKRNADEFAGHVNKPVHRASGIGELRYPRSAIVAKGKHASEVVAGANKKACR